MLYQVIDPCTWEAGRALKNDFTKGEPLGGKGLNTAFTTQTGKFVSIIITIIIYSGYPLHRSVFQWGPANIMYNTVTIQYNAIRYAIRLVSFNAVFYS